MKRVLLTMILVAILLTGCKQEGFETDINLASGSQSAASSKSQSSESVTDLPDNPSSPASDKETDGNQPASTDGSLAVPAVILPDTALSDQDMSSIYGLTWNNTVHTKLESAFMELDANMPEMSMYRACYLLELNPLQLDTYAGWYINTSGSMVLYFTYPASSQGYVKTALAAAATNLKQLLQPQFEDAEDKARFDNIRFAAESTKAYFIIPNGWSGTAIDFRQAYREPDMIKLKDPPFPVEGITASTPYVQLAADQMEYEVIKALGFTTKPSLGTVTSDIQLSEYLGLPPNTEDEELGDGGEITEEEWDESWEELD